MLTTSSTDISPEMALRALPKRPMPSKLATALATGYLYFCPPLACWPVVIFPLESTASAAQTLGFLTLSGLLWVLTSMVCSRLMVVRATVVLYAWFRNSHKAGITRQDVHFGNNANFLLQRWEEYVNISNQHGGLFDFETQAQDNVSF